MAKIEMDVQEYDLMRENKKLLEDALNREKELHSKIESLNKEKEQALEDKIKAYEEAKMSVAYVTKTENIEYAYSTGTLEQALHREFSFLRHERRFGFDDIKNYNNYIKELVERIIFPNLTRTKSFVQDVKLTEYKGFDEVRSEIKKELKDSLDIEIKQQLEEYHKLSGSFNELTNKLSTLESERNNWTNIYEANTKEIQSLDAELNELLTENEKLTNIINKINNRLSQGYSLFNKSAILDDILIYLREFNDKK